MAQKTAGTEVRHPLRVSHPLDGPRSKLAWAQEKLYALQLEVQAAHTPPNNPYRVLEEHDMETGRGVLRVVVFEPLPFDRWSLLLGDIVHAMRSALDYTAYQLGCLRKDPPGFTEFPVLTDPDLWDELGLRKIRNLPEDTWAEIEGLQPYQRGDLAHLDPLAVIHELDIIDKHRRLNLVGATMLDSRVNILTLTDATVSYGEPVYGAFENGAEIGRFAVEITGPNPRMQVQHQFVFGITLSEPFPEAVGRDALAFVTSILPYVGAVISRFEPFFEEPAAQD